MPNFETNACASFPPADRDALWQAAMTLVEEQDFIIRIIQMIGAGAGWLAGQAARLGAEVFGDGWQKKITDITERALACAMDMATFGLDPTSEAEPWNWFSKTVTTVSGVATGLFGLPGASVDIPVTTLLIMRSVAAIARAHGENLNTADTRRACLEVFAFGGGGEDDEPEIAYWVTRAALATIPVERVAKLGAARLGVLFSEKLLAQAAPVAGGLAGGAVNYLFMDYYQKVAGVHFVLRDLERRYDPDGVRACFDNLVRQAKARKRQKQQGAAAAA